MKSLKWAGLSLAVAAAWSTPVSAQDHDHSPQAVAAEIAASRRKFSRELEKMKSLAGRWEGTTTRAVDGTNSVVVTYSITGAGSAVVETLFPGTSYEMTTVYHDDSQGRLQADHYCTAANQPRLRLIASKEGRLDFELSPESDIQAAVEGHAHQLTLLFGEDGSLQHEWLNHYLGNPGLERGISLKKAR